MSMKTRVTIGCIALLGASIALLISFIPQPPNYLAVINQRQSAGVTPEENFWVAALKVIPLDDQTPEYVEKLATFPGFEDAGNSTVCFEDFPDFNKDDRSCKALSEPWKSDELPEVDDWVNRNKGALDWLAQAANLPKAYFPAIQKSEDAFLKDVLLPHRQVQRGIVMCFVARANRALASGDVEGAWNDLTAVLKIARHIEESSQFMISDFVAIAVKAVAAQPLVNCIVHSEWPPAEIQNRWQQIAPMLEPRPVFLSFEQCERSVSLDTLIRSRLFPPPKPAGFVIDANGEESVDEDKQARYVLGLRLRNRNIDHILRRCNEGFDAMIAETKRLSIGERFRANLRGESPDVFVVDAATTLRLTKETMWSRIYEFLNERNLREQEVDRLVLRDVSPLVSVGQRAVARELIRKILIHAAFAHEIGIRSGSRVPENSNDLYKMCLSLQPAPEEAGTDLATTGFLKLIETKKGIDIYSVGANRIDDGGSIDNDNDDIVITIPRKPREEQNVKPKAESQKE